MIKFMPLLLMVKFLDASQLKYKFVLVSQISFIFESISLFNKMASTGLTHEPQTNYTRDPRFYVAFIQV